MVHAIADVLQIVDRVRRRAGGSGRAGRLDGRVQGTLDQGPDVGEMGPGHTVPAAGPGGLQLAPQQPQFLAIREELLLQALSIVEAAGARFAEPMPWAEGAPPGPAR